MSNSTGKSALGIVQKYHPEVRKVIDAAKSVEIKVSAADCKAAKRRDAVHCAMANACKRHGYDGAIISSSKGYLVTGKLARRYVVPESLSREIVVNDRSKAFAPGIYRLRAPSKSGRLGARGYAQAPTRTKNGGQKQRSHFTAGIRSL